MIKKIILVFIGIIIIGFATGILTVDSGENEKDKIQPATAESNQSSQKLNYTIIDDELNLYDDVFRYNYHVVVEGEPGVKELKNIAQKVAEKAKDDKEFNALRISFYDRKEYVGHGITLGNATFALNGDWGEAQNVVRGDYDVMEFKYNLLEKNWDKKLTDQEVEIWSYYKKYSESTNQSQDEIFKTAAKKFSMTAAEVKDIVFKKVFWNGNNKTK
jgi:hypothetical protein